MKKAILIIMLLVVCGVLSGCRYTLDRMSRFNTGNVDARDITESLVNDELAFRKTYW